MTRGIFIALFCAIMGIGCAGQAIKQPTDVAIRPARQYKHYLEKEGLGIAIDPLFQKDRVESHFGMDLLAKGILPVLIVVENNHPESVFLLEGKNITLAISASTEDENRLRSGGEIPQFPYLGEESSYPLAMLTTSPIKATQEHADISKIKKMQRGEWSRRFTKEDWEIYSVNDRLVNLSYYDKTIFPRETHHGIAYFMIENPERLPFAGPVAIRIKEIPSCKEMSFDFTMDKGDRH